MAKRAGRNLLRVMRPLLFAIRHSLLVVALIVAVPAAAQSPQEIQKVTQDVIKRLDLQTELPKGAEPLRFDIKLPQWALWLVIAIALGVLLYAFSDMIPILRARQRGAWSGDEAIDGAVEARAPTQVL